MNEHDLVASLRNLVAHRGGACRLVGDRLVFADEPEFGAHDQQPSRGPISHDHRHEVVGRPPGW